MLLFHIKDRKSHHGGKKQENKQTNLTKSHHGTGVHSV